MYALISVSDKTGIVDFAKELSGLGVKIISTGGTFSALANAGVDVCSISDITGFPECFDGRVKTLHPKIHGGILAMRDNPDHMKTAGELGIDMIDFVVVNLYPFKETRQKFLGRHDSESHAEIVENIDIGGPTMLRSAAKNYKHVSVITDPADYTKVLDELKQGGSVFQETKLYLATKVFMHTAQYDAMVAQYFREASGAETFPQTLTLTYEKVQDLRYGENPHQAAAYYKEVYSSRGALVNAVQLQGKELSFNNINDTHGALELLREYDEPTVVACKHSNPCGVASGANIHEAYVKTYNADPLSIFGGIVVANGRIEKETALMMADIFLEIILAPDFSDEALEVFKKKKNLRILKLDNIGCKQSYFDEKRVSGGMLIQESDQKLLAEPPYTVVTKRQPSEKELSDLMFTWRIAKYVKSNGIAIGKDKQSVGIGVGQTNRIWACKQAIEHAAEQIGPEATVGAVLASDAFFPFSDCVEEAHKAGITAIIQPGGSIKDKESIEACDKYGIAMVFTEMRHFRH